VRTSGGLRTAALLLQSAHAVLRCAAAALCAELARGNAANQEELCLELGLLDALLGVPVRPYIVALRPFKHQPPPPVRPYMTNVEPLVRVNAIVPPPENAFVGVRQCMAARNTNRRGAGWRVSLGAEEELLT